MFPLDRLRTLTFSGPLFNFIILFGTRLVSKLLEASQLSNKQDFSDKSYGGLRLLWRRKEQRRLSFLFVFVA